MCNKTQTKDDVIFPKKTGTGEIVPKPTPQPLPKRPKPQPIKKPKPDPNEPGKKRILTD